MKIRLALTALIAAVGLSSTAALHAELPPLSSAPTGKHLPGKFVWADLYAVNPITAARFYRDLFSWNVEVIGEGDNAYTLLKNGSRPVAGIVARAKSDSAAGGATARWIGYISTTDVNASADKARALGGSIILAPSDAPARGRQALIADAEGAYVGLLNSSAGDPADRLAETGDWIYARLFSRKVEASTQFYKKLAGYDVAENTASPVEGDFLLSSQGFARAGIIPMAPRSNSRPSWVGFVRVKDVAASTTLAITLGGRAVIPPQFDVLGGRVAVLIDPEGAAFGIFELSPEAIAGK